MAELVQKLVQNQNSHLYTPTRITRQGRNPLVDDNPVLARQLGLGNQVAQKFSQSCPLKLPGPGMCPFGGACHACPPRMQAKLKVGLPGDKYEQEADRVADAVMRMPQPVASKPVIQRKCPECEEEVQRQPDEEDEVIQAKAGPGGVDYGQPNMVTRIQTLRSGGQPLPGSERTFFRSRFGHDFSGVQVHFGPRAEDAASLVNARAFTVGSDVVFGAGQYAPGTMPGRHLLAHELTHVLQQGRIGSTREPRSEKWKEEGAPNLQRQELGEVSELTLGGTNQQENLRSEPYAGNHRLQRAFDNNPSLNIGESGEAVRLVQEGLARDDFKMPRSTRQTGELDGMFGTETYDTVVAFQVKHNLGVDGIVGHETMGRLDDLAGTEPPLPICPEPGVTFDNAHSFTGKDVVVARPCAPKTQIPILKQGRFENCGYLAKRLEKAEVKAEEMVTKVLERLDAVNTAQELRKDSTVFRALWLFFRDPSLKGLSEVRARLHDILGRLQADVGYECHWPKDECLEDTPGWVYSNTPPIHVCKDEVEREGGDWLANLVLHEHAHLTPPGVDDDCGYFIDFPFCSESTTTLLCSSAGRKNTADAYSCFVHRVLDPGDLRGETKVIEEFLKNPFKNLHIDLQPEKPGNKINLNAGEKDPWFFIKSSLAGQALIPFEALWKLCPVDSGISCVDMHGLKGSPADKFSVYNWMAFINTSTREKLKIGNVTQAVAFADVRLVKPKVGKTYKAVAKLSINLRFDSL